MVLIDEKQFLQSFLWSRSLGALALPRGRRWCQHAAQNNAGFVTAVLSFNSLLLKQEDTVVHSEQKVWIQESDLGPARVRDKGVPTAAVRVIPSPWTALAEGGHSSSLPEGQTRANRSPRGHEEFLSGPNKGL